MTKEEQILFSVNDRELVLKMETSHFKSNYKVIETSVSNSWQYNKLLLGIWEMFLCIV